jgi:hypothetical protein
MVSAETMELVHSLLQRTNLREAADAAFKKRYPDAPQHMIESATFHVFSDGIGAALEWVAGAEQFLRDPSKGLNSASTYHVLYHLYNWQQLEAILPAGRAGMLEWLDDLKHYLAEGDMEAAERARQQLEEMLQAGLRPPQIDQ